MPAIEIFLDGARIATVCTDELDVLGVNASGTLIDDDMAGLNVCGSRCPDDEAPTSLTWIGWNTLRAGQQLKIAFRNEAMNCDPGKTLEERYPDEANDFPTDFKPTAEMFDELRKSPKLREGFSFQLSLSSGAAFAGETLPEHHGFGFTVLWNSFHPETIRVSLHTYTLDSLENRSAMSYLVEDTLLLGESVVFSVAEMKA